MAAGKEALVKWALFFLSVIAIFLMIVVRVSAMPIILFAATGWSLDPLHGIILLGVSELFYWLIRLIKRRCVYAE